jgi:hypothetical protein
LNRIIDKLIFLTPPDGSDIPANKVLRLNKSLYGLKQSPRLFNKALDKWRDRQEWYRPLLTHVSMFGAGEATSSCYQYTLMTN